MIPIYEISRGDSPLVVSMPHSGTELPPPIHSRLTAAARQLPDTDWHIPALYDFAQGLDATIVAARFSRYVVDLNRPPSNESLYPGQATTGLCPEIAFDGTPIYADGAAVSEMDVADRLVTYWRPYHDALQRELTRIKDRHGYAILYDCHSILSRVPRLFEGRLPDLNLGTARGTSCDPELEAAATAILEASSYSHVVNGRFVGGFITRHYGQPANRIHALQMEIVEDAYMDEAPGFPANPEKAARLKPVLRQIFEALLAWEGGRRR